MTSLLFKNKRRDLQSKGSSALIITLVVMVLITLLVVSLSSMVGVERITSHSSFENEKARQFGQMAIDEALATLKDNIPASNQWAAAPGHLYVYTGAAPGTLTSVSLFSGQANGSATGSVDLNSAVLGGVSSNYPIVPINNEYHSEQQMPVAWVDVLQDGTIIRSTSGASVTSANPIVGRYAYWVDTENAKVNLNTAGLGQVSYLPITNTISAVSANCGAYPSGVTNQFATNWNSVNLQNLSGSPGRVDLSQLDGITPAESVATFHYTYGGYYGGTPNGDYLGSYNAWVSNGCVAPIVVLTNSGSALPATAESYGLQKFNSIWDWAQLTSDPLITANPSFSISQAMIETNLFYLTVKSRTPEVMPLGPNKMWLQSLPAQQQFTSSIVPGGDTPYGNIANARGPTGTVNEGYPLSATNATQFPPFYNGYITDTRLYCYPWNAAAVATTPTPDGQWIGNYYAQTFITYFMNQLKRTDWPGMPSGKSFVNKYGETECEDLALNLYWLWCNANDIANAGPSPSGDNTGSAKDYDRNGHYLGGFGAINASGTTPLATSNGRLSLGHPAIATGIEAPYINEVAVTFTPTTSGYTPNNTAIPDIIASNTNLSVATNYFLQTYTTGGPMWTTSGGYTKDGGRPGFAPPIGSTALTQSTDTRYTYMNVAMSPYMQLYYPPGFKDTYFGTQTSYWLLDVLVTATGTWTPQPIGGVRQTPINVTYGGVLSYNDQNQHGKTADGGSQYYWGFPDDHPNIVPTTAQGTALQVLGASNGLQLYNVAASSQTGANGVGGGTGAGPTFTPGSYVTMGYGTFSGGGFVPTPIYIGPFDKVTTSTAGVQTPSTPKITLQFRVVSIAVQHNTGLSPLQSVPLGCNYGTASSATAPAGYGNGLVSRTATMEGQAYTNVLMGTGAYSCTLPFTINGTNSITNGADPTVVGPTLDISTSSTASVAYEATDPRVFKYVSDWHLDPSPTHAANTPSGYATGISPGTSFSYYTNATTYDALNPWVSGTTPEDDSKFAAPQSPFNEFLYGLGAAYGQFKAAGDPRWSQSANNITGLPGLGWFSTLPLNLESGKGSPNGSNETNNGSGSVVSGTNYPPTPWRTLSLGPVTTAEPNLPDWLILEAFAIAYDQTYLSQTDGKINVNGGNIYPFGFTRTKPLAALIDPTAYTNTFDNPALGLQGITNDLTTASFANQSDYTNVGAWTMPTDAFVYPEQIVQMGSLANTASTGGNATNQWQRESLMRNILGTITTKCSDFKVHIIAQSVKQLSGSSTPAAANLQVTGEQRMSAIISRETNVGPDDLPSTVDDPTNYADSVSAGWGYKTYYPGFKYVVSDIEYINN